MGSILGSSRMGCGRAMGFSSGIMDRYFRGDGRMA